MTDSVNHPAHYAGKVECIEAIEAALGPAGFVAFLQGQVIKYTWRLGKKNDALEDSQKAAWYQARLVQALEAKKLVEPACLTPMDSIIGHAAVYPALISGQVSVVLQLQNGRRVNVEVMSHLGEDSLVQEWCEEMLAWFKSTRRYV